MILIFKPDPPYLNWYRANKDNSSAEGNCEFTANLFDLFFNNKQYPEELKAIGYYLYHGGEEITKGINQISIEDIPKVGNCIRYMPEYNNLTLKIVQLGLTNFPNIPHYLFCDTAFFTTLPPEASAYAIPIELVEKGIRRYGGCGLFHKEAWETTKLLYNGSCEKLISVYIGNNTNIVAIKNGLPLETTIGFTPVEGIPASTSCGDLDPTIIFQLISKGMSFEEINELLARESGFSGLLGYKCTFSELIRDNNDTEKSKVRELLIYNILKYIGAYISILGGVDTIAFISEDITATKNFIYDVCAKLEYLKLKLKMNPVVDQNILKLTEGNSEVRVFNMQTNRHKIMLEKIKLLQKNGEKQNGK